YELTLLNCLCTPRDLQPLPTRRSSDLGKSGAGMETPHRHTIDNIDVVKPGSSSTGSRCCAPPRTPAPAPSRRHRRTGRPAHSVQDRKSTRLNSSHVSSSYAVFCAEKQN